MLREIPSLHRSLSLVSLLSDGGGVFVEAVASVSSDTLWLADRGPL